MRTSQKARYIISFCMLAVALFSAFILFRSHWPTGTLPYEEVDLEQALEYMEYEKDYMLIELDSPELFPASAVYNVPNVVNIPYEKLLDNPLLAQTEGNAMIYVYSEDDECSVKAAMKLTSTGYTSVTRIINSKASEK